MSKQKSTGWRAVITFITFCLLTTAWFVVWLTSLYRCLPLNYTLSLVPLAVILYLLARGVSRRFVLMAASLTALFFVVFDFVYGAVPWQMNVAARLDAKAVLAQWGGSLYGLAISNYIYDVVIDILIWTLIIVFIRRIITLIKEDI